MNQQQSKADGANLVVEDLISKGSLVVDDGNNVRVPTIEEYEQIISQRSQQDHQDR